MLMDKNCTMPIANIADHFDLYSSGGAARVAEEARCMLTSVGAQVQSRLSEVYITWPWRLLRCADLSLERNARCAIAREFWAEPACELDSDFSEPLRACLTNWEELVGPGCAPFEMLVRLARQGRATNMGIRAGAAVFPVHQAPPLGHAGLASWRSSSRRSRTRGGRFRVSQRGLWSGLALLCAPIGRMPRKWSSRRRSTSAGTPRSPFPG